VAFAVVGTDSAFLLDQNNFQDKDIEMEVDVLHNILAVVPYLVAFLVESALDLVAINNNNFFHIYIYPYKIY
jgi:hypothetical protein